MAKIICLRPEGPSLCFSPYKRRRNKTEKINISVDAGFFTILCHLKLVFGFLQRASEPEELTEFIEENTKEFSSLTEDAYDMIASMSKTGELKELKKKMWNRRWTMICVKRLI